MAAKAAEKNKEKSGVVKYALIIVIALVIICAFIALLLYRDSAQVATKNIVRQYYRYIAQDDEKSFEKLFNDKDKAEIVKAAGSFTKYFGNVGKALVNQYGSGYSISLENYEYTEFDSVVKKSYETAYETSIAYAGIISFDVTFASKPSAKLDGGEESEIVATFRDSLVVIKVGGDWYPAVSVALNNGLSQRYYTALKVGDRSVSIAEYNFFYQMLSSGLSEGETLSDSEALAYMSEVYTMCAAAEKAGFKPAQEDIEEMEAQLAEIKKTATSFGDAEEKYYSAYYGMGMTYDLLYDVYYAQLLMQSYIAEITDKTTPDDAAMQEYYEKNKNMFDTVDFVYYEIYSSVEGSLSDATEHAMQILADSADIEQFKAQCKAVYDGLTEDQKKLELYMKEAELGEDYTYTDFYDGASEFRDWLFSEARIEGDKKYFAVDSGDEKIGYIIVMAYVVSPRSRAEYNTVNFMYLTVSTENVKEDEALDRITKSQDEWINAGKTEEEFSKLADKYFDSEDENEDGGSYVRISMGDMVGDIDRWVFDAARQKGDYTILKTEGGYHLIYFVGEDIIKWQLEVKSQMSYDNVAKIYEDTSREIGISVLGLDIAMYC
ncbi:MAG: peptidylprolyl isomerase [Clostridia bacterium]|nr:peptidylprolyl isomerase [Clostridia bacterium]